MNRARHRRVRAARRARSLAAAVLSRLATLRQLRDRPPGYVLAELPASAAAIVRSEW